jgi:hypothetical protein
VHKEIQLNCDLCEFKSIKLNKIYIIVICSSYETICLFDYSGNLKKTIKYSNDSITGYVDDRFCVSSMCLCLDSYLFVHLRNDVILARALSSSCTIWTQKSTCLIQPFGTIILTTVVIILKKLIKSETSGCKEIRR